MQFTRIRCFAAVLAIALAATVMSASGASARVLDAPRHQNTQAVPAQPPVVAPAIPEDLRAAETSGALAPSVGTPRGVRISDAAPNPTVNDALTQPKIAAPSVGFHWGDAAIGGAIALAIVSLVTVGTLAIRRRALTSEA